MAGTPHRRLGPEPWGRRFRRGRENAGRTIEGVAELLFPHVSRSAMVRLEARDDPPVDRKNRGRAALLTLFYGYDLDSFDLAEDDLPPAIDLRALERIRRTTASTKCFTSKPHVMIAA